VPPDVREISNQLAYANDARRIEVVQSLQRLQGNTAVQRMMLARRESADARGNAPALRPAVQRDPPTVDVRDLPMADPEKEKIRSSARTNLPIWADTFANLWLTANIGALSATAEPDDPDFQSASGAMAKAAFGTSLAGNLVWAATSLLAPEDVILIRLMSFGGAAVGSGTISTVSGDPPKSTQPSFKAPVAAALAAARDRIVAASQNRIKDVADDCAGSNVSDLEEQKKKLWAKTFTTAYNLAEPITTAAAAKLAKAAPDFVAQWHTHKNSKAVTEEAWRRTEARIAKEGYPWSVKLQILWEPSGPGGPADVYKLGLYNNEELPKYAAETFHPTLNFG
jgi:hypothetical protein